MKEKMRNKIKKWDFKEIYRKAYTKNAEFLEGKPWLKKTVLFFNRYASLVFFAAYLFLLAFDAFTYAWTAVEFVNFIFLPALALLLVSIMQLALHRPRPYEGEKGIVPLAKKSSKGNSFPSRHLCSAAVISTILIPYFPILSGVLFVLSAGLAYSRFSAGWHYPTDLVAGFLLGALIGCGIFLL